MRRTRNIRVSFLESSDPFEARYLAFLETISTLRPALHRYCARMTASVMTEKTLCRGFIRRLSEAG